MLLLVLVKKKKEGREIFSERRRVVLVLGRETLPGANLDLGLCE